MMGLSIDIETHFEGQIYSFVDLCDTCVLDFHFQGDRGGDDKKLL